MTTQLNTGLHEANLSPVGRERLAQARAELAGPGRKAHEGHHVCVDGRQYTGRSECVAASLVRRFGGEK